MRLEGAGRCPHFTNTSCELAHCLMEHLNKRRVSSLAWPSAQDQLGFWTSHETKNNSLLGG